MSNIKKYLKENYEQSELQEIAEGGLEGGISGFIYYSETCSFYDENEEEIWELLEDDADQYGYKDINSFIATFKGDIQSLTQYKNILTWYAVERQARQLVEDFWGEFAA
jgi:hypothetical protein